MAITDERAILLHLSDRPAEGQWHSYSSFVAALRDARAATGRNLETGVLEDEPRSGNWLGALGYMALLDQIGKCFRSRGVSCSKHPVRAALECFAGSSDTEAAAVYALRCSFAHDYALVNRREDPLLQHHFQVNQDETGPLVALPKTAWDGKLGNRNANNRTVVNLRALGDVTEQVVATIREMADRAELVLVLPGGADELFARYFLERFVPDVATE